MSKAMKIVLILLGVILVVVIATFLYIKSMMPSGDGNNDITEGYYKLFRSDAPLEMKYAQPGSYETSYTEFASDNESIGKIRLWYPQELMDSDKSWPMILVVNASGTPASSYEPFFPRLASWGFVVVGNEDADLRVSAECADVCHGLGVYSTYLYLLYLQFDPCQLQHWPRRLERMEDSAGWRAG